MDLAPVLLGPDLLTQLGSQAYRVLLSPSSMRGAPLVGGEAPMLSHLVLRPHPPLGLPLCPQTLDPELDPNPMGQPEPPAQLWPWGMWLQWAQHPTPGLGAMPWQQLRTWVYIAGKGDGFFLKGI